MLDTSRYIAQARNQRGWNFLSQYMQEVETAVRALQSATPTTTTTVKGTSTPTVAKAGASESLPATVAQNPSTPVAKKTSIVTPTVAYRTAQAVPVTPAGLALIDMGDTNHINKLLESSDQITPVTSSPSTSSTTPALVPEMTYTLACNGRPVSIDFSISYANSAPSGTVFFQVYIDGNPFGPQSFGCSPIASQNVSSNGSWLAIGLAGGSHTFSLYWWVTNLNVCTANGLNRFMEIIQL